MKNKILIGVGIMVIIVVAFFFFKGGDVTGNSIAIDTEGMVKIPLSDISEKAQFYDYNGIEYFVVKASNGAVKTAFNACDVCYRSKKGYRQEGDDMICNNCGNYYPISGLGTKNLKGGGCWPGYLPSKVEGDYLIITKSDLEAGRYRF